MRNRTILFLLAALPWASVGSAQVSPHGTIQPNVAGFSAFVGDPFSQTFTCTGCGTGTIAWSMFGTLPAGITFNTSTGVMSGTPTTAQGTQFRLTATVSGVTSALAGYNFVTSVHQLVWSTPAALAPATAGGAMTRTLQVNLSSLWTASAGTLPSGVSVSTPPNGGTSATLTGTFPAVTTPTTYSFQATATVFFLAAASVANSPESNTRTFSIVVNPAPALPTTFADGEAGIAYQGSAAAKGGTGPLTYSLAPGKQALPPGLTLNSATGAITGTPTAAGAYQFTLQATDANNVSDAHLVGITVVPAPGITTTSLPGGQVGSAFSATLTATGGVLPYTWSIAQGSLPAGLSLNASSGAISGTPTAAGAPSFTARVADPLGGSATAALSIRIAPPPLTISGVPTATATVGTAYSGTFSASGGNPPYAWSIASGALPAGVTLSAGGVLSGTPGNSAAGSYTFTVRVTDTPVATLAASAGTSVTRDFTLQVSPPSLTIVTTSLPGATAGTAYSGTFSASGGNPPYTWSIASGALPAGVTLSAAGVLSGTPGASAAGSYTFTVRVTDTPVATLAASAGTSVTRDFTLQVSPPSLTITTASLPVATAGTAYSGTFSASGGNPPYAWSIASGALPAGVTLSGAGELSGIPDASTGGRSFSVTVRVTDTAVGGPGASAMGTFSLQVSPPTLTITTASLPHATAGALYSATLAASGGVPPYAWTLATGQLPAGLALRGDGTIGGTPAGNSGPYNFEARVTDGRVISVSRALVLQLDTGTVTVTIVTASLPGGSTGNPYNATLQASGGSPPYRWSLSSGSLPAGLALSDSGTLSGTPTAAGTATVTIVALDSQNQPDSKTYSIAIGQVRVTGSPAAGSVGAPYSATLPATGGTAPYTFALTAGALPPGLSLNSASGAIGGTPTTAGTYAFTVTATDAQRASGSQGFSVTITGMTVSAILPPASVQAAYSGSVTAAGGAAPYTYAVSSGSLPAGLSLNAATGVIAGTPIAGSVADFAITATDSQKLTATGSFTITVNGKSLSLPDSLPDGEVGTAYHAVVAAGGVTPYQITVAGGNWPGGLTLDASGAITGTPSSAGDFAFSVRVSDASQPSLTASHDYTLTVRLPRLPGVTLTRLPDTASPGSQPSFGVSLGQQYPINLTGTATIAFEPLAGPADPDVKFANGQTSITFTIAAGQVDAIANGAPMAFSAGTTAGSITITLVVSANGQVLLPNPALVRTIQVPKAAPVISSVRMVQTASGINVLVSGYSNTREISGATLSFTPAAGANLTDARYDVSAAAFQTWFGGDASAAWGGQFLLTVPFTMSNGTAASLASVQAALTNSVGQTTASGGF